MSPSDQLLLFYFRVVVKWKHTRSRTNQTHKLHWQFKWQKKFVPNVNKLYLKKKEEDDFKNTNGGLTHSLEPV